MNGKGWSFTESGRVSCVAFREEAGLVEGDFVSMTTSERARAANGSGSGALDIRALDLRMWEIRGIREVSCHWGHIRSRSSSLKSNTHCNLTSCPLGKLNERFTVPTEMDAGCVRPRRCVEEGERSEEGQLQSCLGIRIMWLPVQLRDYPWFLLATVLINLAGSIAVSSHHELHIRQLQQHTPHCEASPFHLVLCMCVFMCVSASVITPMRRPLTDIVKSYNTLLISLLPWPLTPPPESTTALCPLSS